MDVVTIRATFGTRGSPGPAPRFRGDRLATDGKSRTGNPRIVVTHEWEGGPFSKDCQNRSPNGEKPMKESVLDFIFWATAFGAAALKACGY